MGLIHNSGNIAYAGLMTDTAPRATAPFALIFAILGFVIAAGVAGVYIWDRQKKDEDHNVMIIDQLRRIDDRLTKIENGQEKLASGQASFNVDGLNDKLNEVAVHLAENKSTDNTAISQQMQIVIEHQIKLQNDLAELKDARSENAEKAEAEDKLKQQELALLNDLQMLAPSLMNAPQTDDFWSKISNSWRQWVSVKPRASAGADITTTTGKISRALYELEQGRVESALSVLPDDPRLASFRARAEEYLNEKKAAAAPVAEKKDEKPALTLQPLPTPPSEGAAE